MPAGIFILVRGGQVTGAGGADLKNLLALQYGSKQIRSSGDGDLNHLSDELLVFSKYRRERTYANELLASVLWANPEWITTAAATHLG